MRRSLLLSILLCAIVAAPAFATAQITIQNNDAAGVGFNDATPPAPVGGNPGTTLGEQRLNAFKEAARIWGTLIDSPVEIIIAATWAKLDCSDTGAVLGSASSSYLISDFD